MDFISKVFALFPESRVKNNMRSIMFNMMQKDFHCRYIDNHFEFHYKGKVIRSYYKESYYELAHTMKGYLKEYDIKEGDIVIDAGSTEGTFSIYASLCVGKNGKVIAFEPDDYYYKKLVRNIKLNNMTNVEVIKKGLWNKDQTLDFSQTSDGSSSFVYAKSKNSISMPVTSIDKTLKELKLDRLDFVKMDIESAEIEAVKGAKNIMKKYPVNFAIASYHILSGKKTCFLLEKMFKESGYNSHTSFPEHLTTYASKITL